MWFQIISITLLLVLLIVEPHLDHITRKCQIEDILVQRLVHDPIPNSHSQLFTEADVRAHFGSPMIIADRKEISMSCVDARSTRPLLGTPGGDFSEFVVAMHVFLEECQYEWTDASVLQWMREFIDLHMTESRPFYMHTDRIHLKRALHRVKSDVWPRTRPLNEQEWLHILSHEPELHGCGHVRYMLQETLRYRMNLALLQSALRAYFTLLWDPNYSSRILYEVMQGDLHAHAVAIVEKETIGQDECPSRCLLVTPRVPNTIPLRADQVNEYERAEDMFVYHQSAARAFQSFVTGPFFESKCHERKSFVDRIHQEAHQHMLQTLSSLAPGLPRFSVIVKTQFALRNQDNV